jgi:hypothetical protein
MFRYLAAVAALAALVVPAAQADRASKHHSGPAADNAVTTWSQISQAAIAAPVPPATTARPPASSEVLHGLVHAAIYDAVVAVKGRYEPFTVSINASKHTSVDAAVAAAARGILVVRVPAQAGTVDGAYATFLAGIPDGDAKTKGIRLGRAVAGAYLGLRADDGYDNTVPWVQPPTGAGVFEPIPAGSTPVDLKLKQVRPLTYDDPARYRPEGPYALGSAEYTADFNEVKSLGRVDSTSRSAEQTMIARFWTDHAMSQMNRAVRGLALAQRLDTLETARMMAMAHVSAADTMVACWEAKYYYNFWRPQHAIQKAAADGNDDTAADTSWTHLFNGNHPEYPSGHACLTSGITYGLQAFFGTDKVELAFDSLTVPGETRTFERLRHLRQEITMARIWGGFHFRKAMNDGRELGRDIAKHVTRNHFEKD